MKPKLKPSGTGRLKLNCDNLLSTTAFEFNLRRYDEVAATRDTLVSKYETEASAAKASREKREKELSGKVSVLEQSEGGLMGKKVELEAQAGWS
jgi:hypothetical protein